MDARTGRYSGGDRGWPQLAKDVAVVATAPPLEV